MRAALDLLVTVWVATWIWIGFLVAGEIRDLGQAGENLRVIGTAVTRTGDALDRLDDVPFIDQSLSETSAALREAGREASEGGRQSARSARRLSPLLGAAIAVIPSTSILAVYLPWRMTRSGGAAVRAPGAAWGPR